MPATHSTLQLQHGDTVFSLAASPDFAQDGICFAACASGLYRSQDGGRSWESISFSAEHHGQMAATALAVSPDYAQDRSLFIAVKGGVLRSSDGGDTWFTARFPAPPPLFSALAVSPSFEYDGVLLAGTMEDGVFASSDRGTHWQPWNFGLFDLNVLCIALSPNLQQDETVLAGAETGLYRSANGGRAWRATAFPTDKAPVLCLAFVNEGAAGKTRILAGAENHGLWVSGDEGESWTRLAPAIIPESVNDIQIIRKPDGSRHLFALVNDGLLTSADGGQTWTRLMQTGDAPTALLAAADGSIFVGLLGKGIMRLPAPSSAPGRSRYV